jgi:hypothetical protein
VSHGGVIRPRRQTRQEPCSSVRRARAAISPTPVIYTKSNQVSVGATFHAVTFIGHNVRTFRKRTIYLSDYMVYQDTCAHVHKQLIIKVSLNELNVTNYRD